MSIRSLIGLLFGFTALMAGMVSGVDIASLLWGATLASLLGYIVALVWQGVTGVFARKADQVQVDEKSECLEELPGAAI